jgi:hypothetical protein
LPGNGAKTFSLPVPKFSLKFTDIDSPPCFYSSAREGATDFGENCFLAHHCNIAGRFLNEDAVRRAPLHSRLKVFALEQSRQHPGRE